MAWRPPGDKPLSEIMMVSLLTHIYVSLGLNELDTPQLVIMGELLGADNIFSEICLYYIGNTQH